MVGNTKTTTPSVTVIHVRPVTTPAYSTVTCVRALSVKVRTPRIGLVRVRELAIARRIDAIVAAAVTAADTWLLRHYDALEITRRRDADTACRRRLRPEPVRSSISWIISQPRIET